MAKLKITKKRGENKIKTKKKRVKELDPLFWFLQDLVEFVLRTADFWLEFIRPFLFNFLY